LSPVMTDPDTSVFELQSKGGADIYITKLDAAGNFSWGKSIGGLSQQHAYGIVTDDSANLYITGHYQGTIDFDPDPVSTYFLTTLSAGSTSMFLIKMDSSGKLLWAKDMGVANTSVFGYASGRSIAMDPAGDLLITGSYTGLIDFDPGPQQANMNAGNFVEEIFVAKYSRNGNLIWVDSFEGGNACIGYAVKADAAGNIYVTGSFQETVDFNPGPGTYPLSSVVGLKDIFLCKLGSGGEFRWAFAMGAIEDDYASGLVVDDSANVYITGRFQYTVDFDPDAAGTANRTSSGSIDIFLSKYDSSGAFRWAHGIGSSGMDLGMALAMDLSGNIYLGGTYSGTVDFDPGSAASSLTAAGSGNDLFIAKYDRNGVHSWVEGNGSGVGSTTALTIGYNGDLYAGGYYTGSGSITVGTMSAYLPAIGNTDIFLLKFGCDHKSNPSAINVATCDSFRYNNVFYTASGSYPNLFRNAYGCDSLVTLNLVIRDLDPKISVSGDTLGTTIPYLSYRWLLDGDTIPGAVNPIHLATENGGYQVVVRDTDGCTDTSGIYSINNIFVNDPYMGAARIKIYPNPAHDVLYVVPAVAGGRVVLCDPQGRQVARSPLPASVDLRGLAGGMYLLMVYDQEDRLIHTGKMVRQ